MRELLTSPRAEDQAKPPFHLFGDLILCSESFFYLYFHFWLLQLNHVPASHILKAQVSKAMNIKATLTGVYNSSLNRAKFSLFLPNKWRNNLYLLSVLPPHSITKPLQSSFGQHHFSLKLLWKRALHFKENFWNSRFAAIIKLKKSEVFLFQALGPFLCVSL